MMPDWLQRLRACAAGEHGPNYYCMTVTIVSVFDRNSGVGCSITPCRCDTNMADTCNRYQLVTDKLIQSMRLSHVIEHGC